jgi:hypothetical protein
VPCRRIRKSLGSVIVGLSKSARDVVRVLCRLLLVLFDRQVFSCLLAVVRKPPIVAGGCGDLGCL